MLDILLQIFTTLLPLLTTLLPFLVTILIVKMVLNTIHHINEYYNNYHGIDNNDFNSAFIHHNSCLPFLSFIPSKKDE